MTNNSTRGFKHLMRLLVSLATIASATACNSVVAREDKVQDTTICAIAAQPQKFSGKIVRFIAEYLDDGKRFPVLVDPICAQSGIVTSRQLVDPSAPNPLLDALGKGCFGTIDKRINAKWTGQFFWNEHASPSSGQVPRWLDLIKVDEMSVVPRLGAPEC